MDTHENVVESHKRDELPQDPLYLFACLVAWRRDGDVKAYQELIAASAGPDPDIRMVAQDLLRCASSRPDTDLKKAGDLSR